MKRILVIGCPGAGKSTFARALRDRTALPLWYLDQIWHRPDRTTASREEFDARLNELLQQPAWIIDGNYLRTLEPRLQAADAVFLLDYPVEICLEGHAPALDPNGRTCLGGRRSLTPGFASGSNRSGWSSSR